MPFIVTTSRPAAYRSIGPPTIYRISRRAVATLEEARDYVHQRGATFSVASISESGGTVGPLPDGTVIEVEPRGWEFFNWHHIEPPMPDQATAILAAFNARERAHAV